VKQSRRQYVGPHNLRWLPSGSTEDATVGKGAAWVASMQCRMTGSDEGGVAQELGRVIGGSLGKRVERQTL